MGLKLGLGEERGGNSSDANLFVPAAAERITLFHNGLATL